MNAKAIFDEASLQTGLSDIGDESVLEGLDILLRAYESEARFTEQGMQRQMAKLVAAMSTRLKVVDWLKQHPDVQKTPIDRPLFVFGLPRTGTTLMINLLNADPARRSLLHWEARDPVPPPTPEELHAGPRFEACQKVCEMSLSAVPEIAAIHYEDADSPTECQFAMTPSFCAQVYEAESYVPSYRQWLFYEASYLPAFNFEKCLLQVLQSKASGRWTLKNPWHPLYLNDLVQVFPDAQLVMTHRDPADVVASCCSLIKHVRRIYSQEVDLPAIGVSFMDTFRLMIDRAVAYKEKNGWDAIYDVQYRDVMTDPLGEIRKLYAHFDEPLSDIAETSMRSYLLNNPKGKHGKHEYSLEEYGLTRESVHAHFADYIDRFKIAIR